MSGLRELFSKRQRRNPDKCTHVRGDVPGWVGHPPGHMRMGGAFTRLDDHGGRGDLTPQSRKAVHIGTGGGVAARWCATCSGVRQVILRRSGKVRMLHVIRTGLRNRAAEVC